MTKPQTVDVVVKVPLEDLNRLLYAEGCKLKDNVKLKKFVETESFKESLAKDLLSTWTITNDDSEDVCRSLFGIDNLIFEGDDEGDY